MSVINIPIFPKKIGRNKYLVHSIYEIDKLVQDIENKGRHEVVQKSCQPTSFPAVVVLSHVDGNFTTQENGKDYMYFDFVTREDFCY